MPAEIALYPLRIAPIFQYRMWGGRKLEGLMQEPLPPDVPVGEAWVLSDRSDFPSQIADGALAGTSVTEVLKTRHQEMFGAQADKFGAYPLLLKFLDAKEMLSVQVHPSDAQKDLLPPGERGKTEAWLVLEAEPGSSIYAGLQAGTTADDLRNTLKSGTVETCLASFSPEPGDGLFIEAGTVHALGGGVLVFEVQQNSDVTFRLYDWNRVDAKTGKARELHIEQSIQSTDFSKGPVPPTVPVVLEEGATTRERLFSCEFFEVVRTKSRVPFSVGSVDKLQSLVFLEGAGTLSHGDQQFEVAKGQVWLIPAVVGKVAIDPREDLKVLEICLP